MRRALTLLEGPEVEFAGADVLLVRAQEPDSTNLHPATLPPTLLILCFRLQIFSERLKSFKLISVVEPAPPQATRHPSLQPSRRTLRDSHQSPCF